MSRIARWMRRGRLTLMAALLATLALTGVAYGAFVGLPTSGQQVNNDPPTIDPNQNANLSDLTAGSLAGGAHVPWATFAQSQQNGSAQVVVRAFKAGKWQTEGFPESLSEDPSQAATAPSLDFTGANRTVSWVGWAEPSTVLGGLSQIFASRFASEPAPAQNGGQWIREGQQVTGTAPSLNINTNRSADDPGDVVGERVERRSHYPTGAALPVGRERVVGAGRGDGRAHVGRVVVRGALWGRWDRRGVDVEHRVADRRHHERGGEPGAVAHLAGGGQRQHRRAGGIAELAQGRG